MDTTAIKEHMEVIGADGVHVGTVDHIDGDRIKLARHDKDHGDHAHHAFLPLGLIATISGDKVQLSANADVAAELFETKGD